MLKFLIEDKELEREISKIVIDRVKNFIRNDEKIGELIDSIIEKEVEKKIEKRLINYDADWFRRKVIERVDVTAERVKGQIVKSTITLIKNTKIYKDLVEGKNLEIIKELFK